MQPTQFLKKLTALGALAAAALLSGTAWAAARATRRLP